MSTQVVIIGEENKKSKKLVPIEFIGFVIINPGGKIQTSTPPL